MQRIPQLDGLRGYAILVVLICHYLGLQLLSEAPGASGFKRLFLNGGHGVDLFFILSGFLVGGILLDQRRSPNLLRAFYARRTMRILPLYLVGLGLLLAARWVNGGPLWDSLFDIQLPTWVYLTYTQNLCYALRGWDVKPLNPTWSLAVEEQFYLLLPLLMLLLQPRRLPAILLALIAVAPVLRVAVALFFPNHLLAAYVLLPCRWDALFLGVLIAWGWRTDGVGRTVRANLGMVYAGLALTGVMWAVVASQYDLRTPQYLTLGLTAITGFCLCLFLLALYDPRVARLFDVAPLRWLGSISYGVYLFHEGVASLLHYALKGQIPRLANLGDAGVTLGALLVTLGLAVLSYRLFELPLIRWGQRWKYAAPESGDPAVVEQFSVRLEDRRATLVTRS